VIGSLRAYLSRNQHAVKWVSNYRCLIWTFCNWIPIIGYPRDFPVTYARFNGFLCKIMFSYGYQKRYQQFCLKNFPKDIFNSEICYRYNVWLINKWTSCHTIQEVIALIFSNWPRALRSSDFEISRTINPWIVLHSVQLLLLMKWSDKWD